MPEQPLQTARPENDLIGMSGFASTAPSGPFPDPHPICRGWRSMAWLLMAAVALGAMVLGHAARASGSASPELALVSQHPTPMQVIPAQAVVLFLTFDHPVDHQGSTLWLVFPDGEEKRIAARLEAGPATLYAMIGRLPQGSYELRWNARCPNGATLAGIVPFTVADVTHVSVRRHR